MQRNFFCQKCELKMLVNDFLSKIIMEIKSLWEKISILEIIFYESGNYILNYLGKGFFSRNCYQIASISPKLIYLNQERWFEKKNHQWIGKSPSWNNHLKYVILVFSSVSEQGKGKDFFKGFYWLRLRKSV